MNNVVPAAKEAQGLLDRPNDIDTNLIINSIWKARCLLAGAGKAWHKSTGMLNMVEFQGLAHHLNHAHCYALALRETLNKTYVRPEENQIDLVDEAQKRG